MIDLYTHQKLSREYLRLNDSFALFLEQGCGKTLPTLCRISELLKQKLISNAIVVAPKATMGAWYRDMELFDIDDQNRLMAYVTVINYDKVWRGTEFDREWGCIVLDESHKIKNRTSRRSKFLLKLSVKAKYRYILTGTPIGNGQLENIWSQYAFLDPYIDEHGRICSTIFGSYQKFQDKYCLLNQYWKPYCYKFVDELQDVISDHSYRVTKLECLDLPEKLPDEVYDIELMESKLYKELHKNSTVEELEILAENPLARMTKLRQVCSGYINDGNSIHPLRCEKLKVLEEFLDGWEKKLVIFCEFKLSIQSISELLTKKKIKFVTLDGLQKDKLVWRKFQSDPKLQIIVCQYQSACAGIDLFSADTIIYYEPTLSSNTLDQSRDRIHRSGQTEKCSYIHFITKGTVESAIYKALKGYSDFNEKMFNEYMMEYQKGVRY